MKIAGLLKYILIVLILTATVLLSGCGSGDGDTTPGSSNSVTVNGVSIVPAGAGKYIIHGSFSNVAGIEITISYDAGSLANPQITKGAFLSETMFISNAHFTQNSVKIAAMSLTAFSGNGTLATLSFDVLKAAPKPPVLVSVKLAPPPGTIVGSGNTDSLPDQPAASSGNAVPIVSGYGSVSGSSAQ